MRAIVDFDVCRFFGAVEITEHEKGNFSFKEKGSFPPDQRGLVEMENLTRLSNKTNTT